MPMNVSYFLFVFVTNNLSHIFCPVLYSGGSFGMPQVDKLFHLVVHYQPTYIYHVYCLDSPVISLFFQLSVFDVMDAEYMQLNLKTQQIIEPLEI